jgi:hypothetical protein
MSDPGPLTAGGFAPPPIYPVAPAPDDDTLPDDTLVQDFLEARALAPSLGIMARLDAFATAHGAADDPPTADPATQAAARPNGGIVLHWGPTTDEDLAGTPPPPSRPAPPTPPTPGPASGASPPSPPAQSPDAQSQTRRPAAAPAPPFPRLTPEPDFALEDWDTMPFGLQLQRIGEGLAPATPDTAPLSPLGRVLRAFGQGASDGWGPEPLGLAPDTEQALRHVGIFADPTTGHGGPVPFLNEALIRPAAALLDAAQRGGTALLFGGARALGQTYVEAGGSAAGGDALVRDIVALGTVASIAAGSAPGVRLGPIRAGAMRTAESAASDISKAARRAEPVPSTAAHEAARSSGTAEPTASTASNRATPGGEDSVAESASAPRSGATAAEPAWKSNPYLAGETPEAGWRGTGNKRAIRLEIQLLRAGGRTFDWSAREVEYLTKTGKLPRNVVGHHINDVARYREWAGDPRNIRFVRGREGNLNEHGGNFRNSTIGQLIDRAAMIREATGGQ